MRSLITSLATPLLPPEVIPTPCSASCHAAASQCMPYGHTTAAMIVLRHNLYHMLRLGLLEVPPLLLLCQCCCPQNPAAAEVSAEHAVATVSLEAHAHARSYTSLVCCRCCKQSVQQDVSSPVTTATLPRRSTSLGGLQGAERSTVAPRWW